MATGLRADGGSLHSGDVKSLAEAWRSFRGKRSPQVIAAALAIALLVRLLLGDFAWQDAVAVAGMVILYPFAEWLIHVYLLHLRPFRVRARTTELATARAHREHHAQPNDLGLVLLGPHEAAGLIFLIVPLPPLVAGGLLAVLGATVPAGALLTAVVTGYALVGIYEWSHYLIHTAYRPRTRYYRSVWRSHRLHHFKNEHYWHGVATTVGDRVLGTFPDHREVPRSKTARTLDAGTAG
jgi:Fatty acid hydroxylase superfamily